MDYRRFFPVLAFLLFYQIARGMTLPLFPQFFVSAHLSAPEIAYAFAAYSISFLIFEALWGFVFEKFSIQGSMPLLPVVVTTVAIGLFAKPTNLTEVLGYEILLGFGLGGAGVYPRLVVAHLAKYSERGRLYGIVGLFYSIGATLGALLGGALGLLIGVSEAFVVAAAITLLSSVPIWLESRSRVTFVDREVQTPALSESQKVQVKINRSGLIVLGLVGFIAAGGGSGFFTLAFPNILVKDPRFLASVIETSIVVAAFSLSSGLMQPIVGFLGSRNPIRWIIVCLFATGVCYFSIIFTQSISQVELIAIVFGIVYSAITPLTLSLLTSLVPKGFLGRVIGLYGAAEDVGLLVGASFATYVWGTWGIDYSLSLMGSICALVGASCYIAKKKGVLGRRPDSTTD